MRVLPLLALVACEVCPTGLAPLPVEIDWTTRFDEVPATRLGTIEARAGDGPSWVCACWCEDAWASAWVGTLDDPHDPVELPWAMPTVDPITSRDFLARLAIAADASAVGETRCHVEVGGRETWTIDVEAP